MIKKIVLESITIFLICASLLLLKVVYSQPANEVASLDNDNNTPAKQTEVFDETPKLIDINLATDQELQQIPGVGEVIAQRIIQDREKNGYYCTVKDIVRVKGIGLKTFEKMQQHIVVNKRNLMLYLGY